MQTHDAQAAGKTVTEPQPLFDAETNAAVAARLFHHIDNNTTDLAPAQVSIDPSIYSDRAVAALEQDRIFDRCPVIVAHESELAEPHDFITVELAGNRALIVRQADGGVKAFVNACRHRGACLETQSCGSRRVFSCGYHGWSYNPDGGLRSVTYEDTFGAVDKSQFGLVELPVEVRHGLVWLVQRPGAELDVADYLGSLDPLLAAYQIEGLQTFRSTSVEEGMNWKVAEDAFVDGYHLKYVHALTAGPHFYTNCSVFEDHGAHSRAISPRKRIDRIRFEPGAAIDPYVTVGNFIFPNTTILKHPDHVQILTFTPQRSEPARCRLDVRVIAPPVTSDDERELWERNFDILVNTVIMEDLPLNRNLQAALSGRGLPPLTLGRNEVGNQIFHREWARRMEQT